MLNPMNFDEAWTLGLTHIIGLEAMTDLSLQPRFCGGAETNSPFDATDGEIRYDMLSAAKTPETSEDSRFLHFSLLVGAQSAPCDLGQIIKSGPILANVQFLAGIFMQESEGHAPARVEMLPRQFPSACPDESQPLFEAKLLFVDDALHLVAPRSMMPYLNMHNENGKEYLIFNSF